MSPKQRREAVILRRENRGECGNLKEKGKQDKEVAAIATSRK